MTCTKLALAIVTIGCGLSTLAFAGGYSSSQTPEDSSGYSSSQTPPFTTGRPSTYGDAPQQTMIYSTKQSHKRAVGMQWVQARPGRAPRNAIPGGRENNGKTIYICQAPFHGGSHPGKIVGYNCNIGYGGKEIITPGYQILVSNSYYSWAPAGNGIIPDFAFPGGYENGEPLFICQSRYAGGVHPGKVVDGNCNITYAGKEVVLSRYNVLVTR